MLDSVHDKSGGVGGGTFGVSYDVLHGGGSSSEFDGHPGIAWLEMSSLTTLLSASGVEKTGLTTTGLATTD